MKLQIRNGSYFNHHITKDNTVILVDMTSLKTKSEYCNSDFIKEASKVFKEFSTDKDRDKEIGLLMRNKFNTYINTLYTKLNINKIRGIFFTKIESNKFVIDYINSLYK